MAEVELRSIDKSYGPVEVLKDASLKIADGEFVVLVGPSGCGKSTLLRCISGLEQVSSGKMFIDGEDITSADPVKRGIAMVFQSYALYPHMTVRENIGFGLKIAKTPKDQIKARVAEVAKLLKLDALLERKPKALSGGQRQRVAIGRALARRPKIFLFDEPLSNLDASLRAEMRVELSKLHAALGNTMIYVTHDQVEAMTLADRIVVMRAGIIEQVGTPLDLFNAPANRFVAGFIGQPPMNFLPVRATPGTVGQVAIELPGGSRIEVPARGLDPASVALLGTRPDDITVDPTGPVNITLDVVEQLGTETLLYGHLTEEHPIVVKLSGQVAHRSGDVVRVALAADRIHLFDRADRRIARETLGSAT